jgi:hypothetical protein
VQGGTRTPIPQVMSDDDVAEAQPCGSDDDRAGGAGGVPEGLPS